MVFRNIRSVHDLLKKAKPKTVRDAIDELPISLDKKTFVKIVMPEEYDFMPLDSGYWDAFAIEEGYIAVIGKGAGDENFVHDGSEWKRIDAETELPEDVEYYMGI